MDENINSEQSSQSNNALPDINSILANAGLEQEQVDTPNTETPFEIDPKYANLDPLEAKYRTMQSRYDQAQVEIKRMEAELASKIKAEMFLNDLLSDDEVLTSFLVERKPDLIQQKETDLATTIANKLKDEFKDYQPDEDELRSAMPGTKAWLYIKRSDDLYKELKGSGSKKLESLKELNERRVNEQRAREQELQAQVTEVKTKLRWDDTKIERFHNWAQNMSMLDLAKTFDFLLRFTQNKSTSVAGIQSTQSSISNNRQNFLKSLK
jgi:hypothetical protein